MSPGPQVARILGKLKTLREAAKVTREGLEKTLILGPGWIERFETAQSIPDLETLLAICNEIGCKPGDLFAGWDAEAMELEVLRNVRAEQSGSDLTIRFPYGDFDASYVLKDATMTEFDSVLVVLRDGLARAANSGNAEAVKADTVAKTFLHAAKQWPKASPSDLWWFLVSRAYCDPFNHPAANARLDFGQSWKRTGGWALEDALVRHYGPFLATKGVRLFIAEKEEKVKLLGQLKLNGRLEADKVDVLLTGKTAKGDQCFGVVHVKASFAERRTDDVPLSQSLVQGGYCSPLWTMDCKSVPGTAPQNRGELGGALAAGADTRSAKRKDIEDDGFFSACFSYNARTNPTPGAQNAKARIYVCDFSNPDDAFSQFIIQSWQLWQGKAASKTP